MMGKPNQLEPKLFYHGVSLDRRMPQDHPLRKIEQLVDFNFTRSKVQKWLISTVHAAMNQSIRL